MVAGRLRQWLTRRVLPLLTAEDINDAQLLSRPICSADRIALRSGI